MTTTILQIGLWQSILGVAVILIGGGIAWGALRSNVSTIKKLLDEEIKPDLKNVRERFVVIEDRVKNWGKDEVAPAHSPRQLNERGKNILSESGIKKIIDEKKNELFNLIRGKNKTNPYDTEQSVLQVVSELKNDPMIVEKLKTGAFAVGTDIDTVLLVGGFYLRDLIFPELGFSITDLDKPKSV
ncbi:MAG: hypothetical protein Q8L01_01920 [Candidatus Woesebacteria bacterium]|nr:hypothetical protein [Candidatus Woesebacteria bacterium]